MDTIALASAALGLVAAGYYASAEIAYRRIANQQNQSITNQHGAVALSRATRVAYYEAQARGAQLAGNHAAADSYDELAALARVGGLN